MSDKKKESEIVEEMVDKLQQILEDHDDMEDGISGRIVFISSDLEQLQIDLEIQENERAKNEREKN